MGNSSGSRYQPIEAKPGNSRSAAEKALGLSPFYLGKKWKRDSHGVFVAVPFDDLYEAFYKMHIADALLKNGLNPVRMDKVPVGDPIGISWKRFRNRSLCAILW
jgi:hypothetical protein